MNTKIILIILWLLILPAVFAINPDQNYTSFSIMDSNAMGAMLVQEWAFGSIDLAFLVLSIITIFILVRYAIPMSIVLIGVMGLATVFSFGFNSIIAYGVLIAGIVLIALLTVTNMLVKTQY